MTPAYEEMEFLRAICEEPEDNTPRLVYADWLEDHDQKDRAQFIRLQCGMSNTCSQCGQCGWVLIQAQYDPQGADIAPNWYIVPCPKCNADNRRKLDKPVDGLKVQQQPLIHWRHLKVQADNLLEKQYEYQDEQGRLGRCRGQVLWSRPVNWLGCTALFERGFVSRIDLPSMMFLQHTYSLFTALPITCVHFIQHWPRHATTRDGPNSGHEPWVWDEPGSGVYQHSPIRAATTSSFPNVLTGSYDYSDVPFHYQGLPAFRDDMDAVMFLSMCAVNYGRESVGLKRLKHPSYTRR